MEKGARNISFRRQKFVGIGEGSKYLGDQAERGIGDD